MLALCLSILPLTALAEDFSSNLYGYAARLYSIFSDNHVGETPFRILVIPSGGKGEALGAAIVALPVGGVSIIYNPAASSMVDATEVSLVHNEFASDLKIETAYGTIRFGDFGLGAFGKYMYMPFSEKDDFGTSLSSVYYMEFMGGLNVSYNILNGYYFGGVALGASAKIAYRQSPDYADEDGNIIPNSGSQESAFAVMGDLGLLSRFNFLKFFASRSKNAAIGLAARNWGINILSDGSDSGESLPSSLSLGLSYAPMRPLSILIDITQPINLIDIEDSEQLGYSLGLETSLFDFFALSAGFQVKGGIPRITAGAQVDLADFSLMANYTIDGLNQPSTIKHFSVELKLNLGDRGRYGLRLKVEELYLKGVEEYALGHIEDAISLWSEAWNLDKSFTPAKQNITMALKSKELKEKLEGLQSLD